jgi:flagellar motor protein MotB
MALADFFTVFSVATFAVYASQRIHMRQADDAIKVDKQVRTLADKLADRLQYYGIAVGKPGPDMAIELDEALLFKSGDYTIKDPSVLKTIRKALSDVKPEWNNNFVLIIRGHTDSVPVNTTKSPKPRYRDNLELSRFRAEEVEKQLAMDGIHPPDFQVVAEGVGEFEPVVANCKSGALTVCTSKGDYLDEQQLGKNRRIELRFGVFSGNAPRKILRP